MKGMNLSRVVIILVIFGVALLGGYFTDATGSWYQGITKPLWTPPGWVFGLAWTLIYALAAISAFMVWDSGARPVPASGAHRPRFVIGAVFLANAFLNVSWTYLFFQLHLFGASVWDAALLGASVVALIVLIWPLSRAAALLLVPYAVWVGFAIDLTGRIWFLNR